MSFMKFDLSKILESYNSLNSQMRYGIFAGVVLLAVVLDVLVLAWPQIGGIADAGDQIKKLSSDTEQVLADKQRIDQLKKNLETQRLALNSLTAKVRPIQEVPAMLSTISSIANQYDVKIEQLVPEKNLQEALSTTSDSKYYALPIVIKAHCGYHMFGRFLNKLENENMYFIVKEFVVQNDDKNRNIQSFSLIIKMILVEKH